MSRKIKKQARRASKNQASQSTAEKSEWSAPGGFTATFTYDAANLKIRQAPIPMLLWCPGCGGRHVDVGEFAAKPHHTHACQHCGHVWRPAVVDTVGVQFLPGYKNEETK